jgi:primosomal protein N' (replication factor Y)
VSAVSAAFGRHARFLLEGITGSGKTEVYLHLARLAIARGEQVMLLLPEIGLTPQLEERFRTSLPATLAVFHSRLTDVERLRSWLDTQSGTASILLGTRSAVFVPMKRPGLIIVDEEHDPSYKQQEGFRFSARDVAIKKARDLAVPILLGSATPCLESLWNVTRERYRPLRLPERAGGAAKPTFQLVDIRQQRLSEGLSRPLIDRIKSTLERRQQILLFINRRGFAPTLICHACGWVAECPRCDARLVIHYRDERLRCHYCAYEQPLPNECPECGVTDLRALGIGTERLEQSLLRLFPDSRVMRIDRDSTVKAGSLKQKLADVHGGEVDILIGTQMLAKGHHLPNVTLVGILDADAMLFATDFRASERTAQLIVQVAGRAGRGDQPGSVMLQTRHPGHPLLRTLIDDGYPAFAEAALSERRSAGLPPFGHLAVWRADAVDETAPLRFLTEVRDLAERLKGDRIQILGPAPAPMLRQAGRHRYQLLLQGARRAGLHALLEALQPRVADLARSRAVRWSLDIDPIDCY